MTKQYYPLFAASELPENSNKAVTIAGKNLLICNANGQFYVIENMCTHQRAELTGGRIRNCFISCPLHGVRFDLRDGKPKGELTKVPLTTYEIRVTSDGLLEVSV
ncbi:MAG: Rieske 2Fe-2S domain-containing protein [Spongiibacteraceae bacterium]